MRIERKRTLYKVKDDEKLVGIFTVPENIPEVERYTIEEIFAWHIDGSLIRGDDVYMALGTRTMLKNDGDEFSFEIHDSGEIWGVNAQSAVAVLFRRWNQAEMKKLLRYRLNKIYPNGMNGMRLTSNDIFQSIADEMRSDGELSPKCIADDHYECYLQEKRAEAARARMNKSEEIHIVTGAIMKMTSAQDMVEMTTDEEQKSPPNFFGSSEWYDDIIEEVKIRILNRFTETELKAAAKLINESYGEVPDPESLENDEKHLAKLAYEVAISVNIKIARDITRFSHVKHNVFWDNLHKDSE